MRFPFADSKSTVDKKTLSGLNIVTLCYVIKHTQNYLSRLLFLFHSFLSLSENIKKTHK